MQKFYTQLSSPSRPDDAYLQMLARVTTLNRTQIKLLASNLDWNGWG